MKITKEKVLRHSLYIAATYMKDDGFCSMETVNRCSRPYRQKGECENCIMEMMLCIAEKELQTMQKGGKNA